MSIVSVCHGEARVSPTLCGVWVEADVCDEVCTRVSGACGHVFEMRSPRWTIASRGR